MVHCGSCINDIHLDPLSTALVKVVPIRILRGVRCVGYVAQLLKSIVLVYSSCRGILREATATVLVDTGDLLYEVSMGQVNGGSATSGPGLTLVRLEISYAWFTVRDWIRQ